MSTVKLSKEFGLSPPGIRSTLIRNNVELRSNSINSRRYTLDHNFFDNIDTEEKAYWLGFIYADGYVTTERPNVGISLAEKDISHLEKFNNSIHSNYPISIYKCTGYGVGNNYARIIVASETMKNSLKNLGVVENKTKKLQFFYGKFSENLYRHFVRGYFDGDGYLGTSANYSVLSFIGTNEMINFFDEQFEKIGIEISKNRIKRHPTDGVVSVRYSGERSYKILKYMYEDSTIYLDRKYSRYLDAIQYFGRLYQ